MLAALFDRAIEGHMRQSPTASHVRPPRDDSYAIKLGRVVASEQRKARVS